MAENGEVTFRMATRYLTAATLRTLIRDNDGDNDNNDSNNNVNKYNQNNYDDNNFNNIDDDNFIPNHDHDNDNKYDRILTTIATMAQNKR